ncbi:fluoride efflux transporter CrcB [Halobacillus sp. Marseille-P3879]|uniref:fluoride efflux transporter CrcB n=1 Tax=Halobacillus TaxID=45667 RepID=UPI000C7E3535|nr:fluoride efflux transporter CrcB [Halobacillus sp. Marseille-P3879]
MSFFSVVLVGTGGFIGAIMRFAVSQFINKYSSSEIPVATLIVNLSGSFLLGLLIGMDPAESIRLLVGVGIMGAFTTFSTFKLEAIQLHADRKWKTLLIYNGVSYGGGIILALAGLMMGRM